MDYSGLADEMLRNSRFMHRHREQRKIDEFLKGGAFIVEFLYGNGGVAAPSEISREMQISTARVAAVLNKLEGKGFITRRIDKSDRRRILVSLTPEGGAQAEEQRREVQMNVARMLSRLGEKDARELVRIMGRLAEIMNDFESVQ